MDNSSQMPPVISSGPAPGAAPVATPPPVAPPRPAKSRSGESSLIKIVIIILLSLLLIGAGLLAYYFYTEYSSAKSEVDAKIEAAVLEAEKALADEKEKEFAEREKNPYLSFSGPTDYGELSFKYPKTWSVYIERDASKGGEFIAYLHPREIAPTGNETVYALRVNIRSETYEAATNRYKGLVQNGKLSSSVIRVNGSDANLYTGAINDKKRGSILLIRIRDKVATLQSDAEIYQDDFNHIIESITFNQ